MGNTAGYFAFERGSAAQFANYDGWVGSGCAAHGKQSGVDAWIDSRRSGDDGVSREDWEEGCARTSGAGLYACERREGTFVRCIDEDARSERVSWRSGDFGVV